MHLKANTFDMDRLNNCNKNRAALAAFKSIAAIDGEPAEVQMSAIAILCQMLGRRYNLDPAVFLRTAFNMIAEAKIERNQHLAALALFMKVEWDPVDENLN